MVDSDVLNHNKSQSVQSKVYLRLSLIKLNFIRIEPNNITVI